MTYFDMNIDIHQRVFGLMDCFG